MLFRNRRGSEDTGRAEAANAPPAAPATSGELSLRSLLELGHELAERNDLFEIADVALFNLMGHFGCAKSALWLAVDENAPRAVELLRTHGIPPAAARTLGAEWSRWLGERPDALREPMTVTSLARIGTVPALDVAEANGVAILAPLATRRKSMGLLALGKRVSQRPFGARDVEVLGASLDFLALALENSRTRVSLVESNRQLRSLNERLEESDRLKNEFLGNLNHELRTPLTIIAAYLDSILQATPDDDPRLDHLRTVRDQTSKLETMLVTLLEFRALRDDALSVEVHPVDLATSLREYTEDWRPGITAGLRELRFSAASGVPLALCDERRVRRILDCLLDNAKKFSPAGTAIRIRVEPDTTAAAEPRVVVEVQDDGPGIAPEHLPAIWDSFRQADGSSTRVHGGLGLGLALARRLALRMNGSLDVESVPGCGATFRLSLPTA